MKRLDAVLSWLLFALLSTTVFGGLWLFGAWEVWWFWPFSTLLFISFAVFLLRSLLRPSVYRMVDDEGRILLLGFGCVCPFLGYVFFRAFGTDVVDPAIRSVLMFVQPVLIFVMIVLGFSLRQLRVFGVCVLVNLGALACYACVNLAVTQSELVLWRPALEVSIGMQRATGTFFNPDHFATVMGIGVSLGLGLLVARVGAVPGGRSGRLYGGILAIVSCIALLLTQSRGAGLALVCSFLFVICWGVLQWPRPWRMLSRVGLLACMLAGVWAVLGIDSAYRSRLLAYFPEPEESVGDGAQGAVIRIVQGVQNPLFYLHTRPRMYESAVLAWKSAPVFGVGAGMHGELSARFAHSGDGDPESGVRPSRNYRLQQSKAVHNDWLQLLEEYGALGFTLFMTGYVYVFGMLHLCRRIERDDRRSLDYEDTGNRAYGWVLGASFAVMYCSVHALSDFSLQIPAVGWLLASIVAIPVARVLRHCYQ